MSAEAYDLQLKRIRTAPSADWNARRVWLEVYLDDEPADRLTTNVRDGQPWNLCETTYRFLNHVTLKLVDADGNPLAAQHLHPLASFTVSVGDASPKGALLDSGPFTLEYNIVEVRPLGRPGATLH